VLKRCSHMDPAWLTWSRKGLFEGKGVSTSRVSPPGPLSRSRSRSVSDDGVCGVGTCAAATWPFPSEVKCHRRRRRYRLCRLYHCSQPTHRYLHPPRRPPGWSRQGPCSSRIATPFASLPLR
jgi:hypothetical protein